jgi:hypothetical protein
MFSSIYGIVFNINNTSNLLSNKLLLNKVRAHQNGLDLFFFTFFCFYFILRKIASQEMILIFFFDDGFFFCSEFLNYQKLKSVFSK